MTGVYANELKRIICHKICVDRQSTSAVAAQYAIPLKTVEKWITAYRKNPHVFDKEDGYIFVKRKQEASRYDHYSKEDLIKELKRRDTIINYLLSVIDAKQ